MSGTDTAACPPVAAGSAARRLGSRFAGALSWMAAAFAVSLALTAIVLAVYGASETGTALARRTTARWCFLMFWPAYAGSALAKFGGPRFAALARHSRAFGLAFAAALSVHVGLVLWLLYVAADQRTLMLFFWAGVACTYLLALFSLPRLRNWLGPRLWRRASEAAMQYIALVFAVDFIVDPLQASGVDRYPLSYLPFVVMVVGGAVLRIAAQLRRQATASKA